MAWNTFTKSCGQFEIEVSPPSPRWVGIKRRVAVRNARHGDTGRIEEIGGFDVDELKDLKYLVDRALDYAAGAR